MNKMQQILFENILKQIFKRTTHFYFHKRSQIGFIEMHHFVESNGDENFLLFFSFFLLTFLSVFTLFIRFKHLNEFDAC